MTDDEILALFKQCSNRGRWGSDDERGTLNYITAEKRVEAASLVRTGRVVSLAWPVVADKGVLGGVPVTHRMLLDGPTATAAIDYIGIAPHDPAITHIDAITHAFWEGQAYNGRSVEEVLTKQGLAFGSIHAQRDGIFTRGVLLDVAAARGIPWLAVDDFVTPEDLEAAEARQGMTVRSGDLLVVYVGRELRAASEGLGSSPIIRAGLHASVLPWLHRREVAVYTGDCTERMPYPSRRFPMPLHQIGLVSMGLCLLDAPNLADLVCDCRELERWEFLITMSGVDMPGATGAPINPIAVL